MKYQWSGMDTFWIIAWIAIGLVGSIYGGLIWLFFPFICSVVYFPLIYLVIYKNRTEVNRT